MYRLARYPFLLLCTVFGIVVSYAQNPAPLAKKGVIDLRQTNLEKNQVILNGEWAIYWSKLLTPADTAVTPTAYVPFPVQWGKTIIAGKPLPAKGYATYSLLVLLPRHRNKLALEVPNTYTSYKLYVNGEEYASAGKPDTTKETSVPKWLDFTTELTTPTDTLHLILQIANFWHSKGGPYKAITIGDKDKLHYNKLKGMSFDLLLTGFLLMGGLFFFGLYIFGKYDKVILYFSLFCISYSYRIIGSGLYVFHAIYPEILWVITVHLEYLSLFVSVIFFSLYTMHLYPKDANKYVMWIEIWSCLILSAIVIIFPPRIFTQLINPFLVVMFSVIAYAFFVYIKAVKNKRLGAKFALLSTGVVLLVFVLINLQYFGVVEPQKALLFGGYISFFFLQSLILSYRFAYTLNQARKEAEQGLVAKNDFLATMSHEIRTPLNSVIGMSHILLESSPRKDQEEQLNVLLFSANNLLSIVNDILDYNKIEAGKINFEYIEMDLAGIARNIISGGKTAADNKGIDLRLNVDPAFRTNIIGDPTRITQVITNLLQNAIKFTKKGYVSLNIKQEKMSAQQVTLTISIEDTGIGIAPEKQKLIFERFTQADSSTSRNFGGTGLGLAICKKILELQGSSLQLISEPGKGSSFYFTQTFPVSITSRQPEPEKIAGNYNDDKPLAGVHLLLVDDNELNILVAKTFLEKWGAIIEVAMNGQEALDKLDINKHRLILMDIQMPVMDGYEATRQMREKGVTIPIIALTASLPYTVLDKVKGVGIDDLIIKPFVPEDLLRVIQNYLNP